MTPPEWKVMARKAIDKTVPFVGSFFSIPNFHTTEGERVVLRLGNPENKYVTNALPNGQRKFIIAYPLDNNKNAADGRIYLFDKFIIDVKNNKLLTFNRTYNYKGSSLWKSWMDQLKVNAEPNPAQAEDFFFTVSNIREKETPSSQPLSATVKAFLREKLASVSRDYNIEFLSNDPQTVIKKIDRNFTEEMTVSSIWDDDSNPNNGRLILHDWLVFGKGGHSYFRWKRRWEGQGSSKMIKLAETLNKNWETKKKDNTQLQSIQVEGQSYLRALRTQTNSSYREKYERPSPIAVSAPRSTSLPEDFERKIEVKTRSSSQVSPLFFSFEYPLTDGAKGTATESGFYLNLKKLFQSKLKSQRGMGKISFDIIIVINPSSGSIRKIKFDNFQRTGRADKEEIHLFLRKIADTLHATHRFGPLDSYIINKENISYSGVSED